MAVVGLFGEGNPRPGMTLSLLLAATLSVAHADEALRSRVIDLLSGVEYAPTAADWAALGNGASDELLAVARDAGRSPTQRGNALVALGYFPGSEARSYLSSLVRDAGAESLLRRKACIGLANAYKGEAVADLAVALESSDTQVRIYAAKALGLVGSAGASTLESRLGKEADASVREAINHALGR